MIIILIILIWYSIYVYLVVLSMATQFKCPTRYKFKLYLYPLTKCLNLSICYYFLHYTSNNKPNLKVENVYLPNWQYI